MSVLRLLRLLSGTAIAMALLVCFLLWPDAAQDDISQICETTALFTDNDRSFMVATNAKSRAFVDACREVFRTMDAPVRVTLFDALRDHTLLRVTGQKRDRMAEPIPKLTAEDCVGQKVRFKRPEELQEDKQRYLQAGFLPLKERRIPLSDVYGAITRGEVALFDATQLLPPRMFNVTVADLSDMHTDAGSIPIYEYRGWNGTESKRCFDWLMYLTGSRGVFQRWGPRSLQTQLGRKVIIPLLMKYSCPQVTLSLKDLGRRYENFQRENIPWSAFGDNQRLALPLLEEIQRRPWQNDVLIAASTNLRRLPKFGGGVDIAERLGFGPGFGGPLVEHTHSLLWLGQSAGGIHADPQDNVLIQLTRSVQVIVIPAACTRLAPRIPRLAVLRSVLAEGMPPNKSRMPFYHVRVNAGEGLVLPSMTQHKVVSTTSHRVGLNAFMEPRFGRMEWPKARGNYFRRQKRGNAAMRVLFLRTMRRLWDLHNLSYNMHTERLELI